MTYDFDEQTLSEQHTKSKTTMSKGNVQARNGEEMLDDVERRSYEQFWHGAPEKREPWQTCSALCDVNWPHSRPRLHP